MHRLGTRRSTSCQPRRSRANGRLCWSGKMLRRLTSLRSRFPEAKTTKIRVLGRWEKNRDGPRVCADSTKKENALTLGKKTQRPLEPELCAQTCLCEIRVSQGDIVLGIACVKRPQVILQYGFKRCHKPNLWGNFCFNSQLINLNIITSIIHILTTNVQLYTCMKIIKLSHWNKRTKPRLRCILIQFIELY